MTEDEGVVRPVPKTEVFDDPGRLGQIGGGRLTSCFARRKRNIGDPFSVQIEQFEFSELDVYKRQEKSGGVIRVLEHKT